MPQPFQKLYDGYVEREARRFAVLTMEIENDEDLLYELRKAFGDNFNIGLFADDVLRAAWGNHDFEEED